MREAAELKGGRCSFYARLAARLIVDARIIVLKKNDTIACNVASRLVDFETIATSEVCDAAPNEVAK